MSPVTSSLSFTERLMAALTPVIAREGFELLLVEGVPRGHVLRLYIDRLRDAGPAAETPPTPAGQAADAAAGQAAQAGVTIDDCARVSRLVSDWLDAGMGAGGEEGASWLEQAYTLEVSSPGLDRPLAKPAHFVRFLGEEVTVQTQAPLGDPGRRRLTGTLTHAAREPHGGITLTTPAGAFQIAYPSITRARLVPDLRPRATKELRHGR